MSRNADVNTDYILSYGVSRVYSEQCNYVHCDIQNFWDKLRHNLLVFGRDGIEIDPEAGRARLEICC